MRFAEPPKERTDSTKYRHHTNENVNLANVVSMRIARQAYYPDNEGIPVIQFTFVGGSTCMWYFDKGDELLAQDTLKLLSNVAIQAGPEKE